MNKLFNTILLNRVSLYGSILTLCCIILLGGCKDVNPITPDGLVEVKTKTISGGNEWTSEDAVGIFMLSENGSIPSDILTVNSLKADNIEYTVTPDGSDASSGTLTAAEAGNKIYYPQDGSEVDFISYYPYRATPQTDPYLYSVSLTDQSVPEELDILWGKGSGFSKTTPEANIDMEHVLSKITFNLKSGDGMYEDLTDATVTIKGMAESVQIDLNDGTISNTGSIADIYANGITPATDYEASFSAIIAPTLGESGRSIEFEIETEIFTLNIPEDDTFERGKHYVYEVTVKRTGVEIGDVEIVGWIEDDKGDLDISVRGIYTAEDLKQFSDDWNATGTITDQIERDMAQIKVIEKWSDNGQFFGTIYLRADIDMSGITDFNPIGSFNKTNSFDYGFTGVFDGNGHKISNLTINVEEYAGLFGYINNGQISNVIIKDCDITASKNDAGGIAGDNSGTITGCKMIGGMVTAINRTGGIAGFNNSGTITGCEMTGGVVTAINSNAGGIVGWNDFGAITGCSMTGGVVTAINSNAGGIAGWNNEGSITVCQMTGGSITATNQYAGGIVGNNFEGSITGCLMNDGTVIATEYNAGGIAGINESINGKIENCTVSGTSKIEANSRAGGIAGQNYQGSIIGCLMTDGTVTATENNAGGIAGKNEGTITGCEMTGGVVTAIDSNAGGIAGSNEGSITVCQMTDGMVTATNNYAGGIAGSNEGSITVCQMTDGMVKAITNNAGGIAGKNEGTITGCEMTDGTVTATNNSAGGIVGYTTGESARIENCKVSGISKIEANENAGGIAGENTGTITVCEMTSGTVKAITGNAGGIAGWNEGLSSKIENCKVSGNSKIEANGYAGGIAGRNFGTITECKMTDGTVTATTNSAGGIVGYNQYGTIIVCKMINGTVTAITSSAGGIAGFNQYGISGCEMIGGTVTATTSHAGGIAGYNEGESARIEDCIVSGTSEIEANEYAGGIVGASYQGTITGCISAPGSVSANSDRGIVVGYNYSTITTCFWSAITGLSDAGINDGGTITGGGGFNKADVKETDNFFTSLFGATGKTPIELMNEALATIGSTYEWIIGNAASGWYPITVKK